MNVLDLSLTIYFAFSFKKNNISKYFLNFDFWKRVCFLQLLKENRKSFHQSIEYSNDIKKIFDEIYGNTWWPRSCTSKLQLKVNAKIKIWAWAWPKQLADYIVHISSHKIHLLDLQFTCTWFGPIFLFFKKSYNCCSSAMSKKRTQVVEKLHFLHIIYCLMQRSSSVWFEKSRQGKNGKERYTLYPDFYY